MASGEHLSPRLFEPWVLDDEIDEDPPAVFDVTRLGRLVTEWRQSGNVVREMCANELERAIKHG